MARIAQIERNTKETQVSLRLSLDGEGIAEINTGVGFFDHMLENFTRHSRMDLKLKVTGDLQVDDHHSIEDAGIVLGTAIRRAIGKKTGITRYGFMILPMDEALALCSIDLSGRPYLSYDAPFARDKVGDMSTEMIREFFYAVSYSAMMTLHLKILTPGNDHHMAEALFKAFAKALSQAVTVNPDIEEVPSTKGML